MKQVIIFDQFLGTQNHSKTFFDINSDYKLTDDVSDRVDFILWPNVEDINARTLKLDVFHSFENQHKHILRSLQDENLVVVSPMVHPDLDHSRHVFVDFMFNRTKAYYSQFTFRYDTKPWYYYNHFQFVECPLTTAQQKTKIFVSPNKTYNGKRIYRKKIVDLLSAYSDMGYLANYDDSGMFLYPHLEFPYITDIAELEQQKRSLSYTHWGYCPPHNAYYQNTFISIYGETIEYGEASFISEKTYDPLIKGHFILPFSNKGFIKLLKDQGILFPSFIDYTYDSIGDDDKRFDAYSNEVKRLLNLTLDEWREEYKNNLDLLHHNKLWFHFKDYDRVDLHKYKD